MDFFEYVGEKNINVVIDEIFFVFLNNENIYLMLKLGINYVMFRIEILREKSGKNNMFYFFFFKIFFICWNFWNSFEFVEIQRWIFVFKMVKVFGGNFIDKEDINYNECDYFLFQVF